MIKITRITHSIDGEEKTYEYYKDNVKITEEEYWTLILRKVYYEMREVYYQDNGIETRFMLLVKGDNDDDN